VVIAHGAHGDGCPGEFAEWPCFAVEQRNDIGLTGLVRALAEAGFVAIAPDINGAYTGGYGEPREKQRFRQIVDATLGALDHAGAGGANRFGVPLAGQVDLGRVGVIGHSRGGMNVVRWATGRATVRSALLVAPFFDPAVALPDIPTTVLVGTCDGDTRLTGGRYITAARRAGTRATPAWRLAVARANHNFYNRALVRLRLDDAREDPPAGTVACVPARRPTGAQQQAFLASVARDHFGATLLGAAPAAWQDLGAAVPSSVHGLDVSVARFPAG
jgi:dienelactone hydrolase